MAYLQFHGKQYPVPAEGLTVGCYDGAALRLPGDDAPMRAVVMLSADGSAIIRRDAPDALILYGPGYADDYTDKDAFFITATGAAGVAPAGVSRAGTPVAPLSGLFGLSAASITTARIGASSPGSRRAAPS